MSKFESMVRNFMMSVGVMMKERNGARTYICRIRNAKPLKSLA